jgi:CRISPR-associated protein Cas8a1/Csx13
MAARKRASGAQSDAPGALTISLAQPGMGFLHRVGLAGLWMTLDAASRDESAQAKELQESGEWVLDARSVSLRWQRDGEEFVSRLLRYAYPFREQEGLMYFRALGDPLEHPAQSFAVHQAMLATFLQHPKSRVAEAGKATGTFSIEEEAQPFAIRRMRDHSFASAPYDPGTAETVAGWLYPGGVVRHVGLGQSTSLTEQPSPMLALRFAPVGCLFFLVRHHDARGPMRQQVSIVAPDVRDLADYADLRRQAQSISLADLYTAGPGDAALRVLTLDAGRESASAAGTRTCRVMTYGTVPWSSQQRTRVSVLDVGRVAPAAVRQFRRVRQALPVRRVRAKRADPPGAAADKETESWFDVPVVPELAADNLIAGRPWWQGFSQFVADKERRDHVFRWEREGLQTMVTNPELMPEGAELTFVRACHEAWRRRMGQLAERARTQRLDFGSLAGREYDKARVEFSRCKTAVEFRRTITDFWSRGRQQPELQQHWPAVLPFLVDAGNTGKWMLGRDLALLALASYQSSDGDAESDGNPAGAEPGNE